MAARAAALLRDSLSLDALHASALIDLYWSEGEGKALDRSLQSLRRTTRLAGTAPAWADLAAAELMRADRDGEPSARLAALDAAVRAVSIDSANPVARFNLALAAERLGLDARAREEWMRYLVLDDHGEWSNEARTRIAAIDRRAIPSAMGGALDSTRIQLLAANDPGALRLRVLTTELGSWSAASLESRSASAAASLDVMRSAGRSLAIAYGDSTLLAVAAELTQAPLHSGVATAAGAFAAAHRATREGRYVIAESLFARAATGPAPTIAAWSRTYEAIQQVYTGKVPQATIALRSAMTDARHRHRDALEARAAWTLAVLLSRAGRRYEATTVLHRIVQLSERLGDREVVAAVSELRGEDRYAAGDERAASHLVIEAMSTLRRHRASLRLRSALNLLAWAADERGLAGAAAVIRAEDAAVALASGHNEFYAEAMLAAARSRLLLGDTVHALATLRDVERSASSLPPSDVTHWLSARAAQLRAAAGEPVSRRRLDSAVHFFGAQRNGVLLVDALLTRAQASTTSDAELAERDLDSALTLLKERATQYRSSAERRALERRIHDVAAQSALSHLARHDEGRALAAIERGRDGAIPAGFVAADATVLDYLVVGDTLVTWRIADGRTTTSRDVIPARAIAKAQERLAQTSEEGTMDRAAASMLYDLLLRRHAAAMHDSRRLVIVADDELAGIPFAALYDHAGRSYVAERVSVRVVPRLADAPPVPEPIPVMRAAFVRDPAFDRTVFPGLAPLDGARTEVDSSRRFYPSSVVLSGSAATTTAVSATMTRTDLVHFASHASFDVERPEQSRLALAPDGESKEGLSARVISGMRLSGLRLAVLSSCESTRSGVADAPFTTGLAKSFHDAGVPGVVGSLWKVDDVATAALMTEFHRHYSRTYDAATALQAAQLAMLHDPNPARRDPASWGAFVLTGR